MSTLAVASRVLKQISRDKRSLAMIFLSPIIYMLVFGYSFSGEIYGVKVGIVNQDEGFRNISVSNEIIKRLDSERLTLINYTSLDTALDKLDKLEIRGVVFFNKTFTKDIAFGEGNITLYLDGGDPVIADNIYSEVLNSFRKVSIEYGLKLPYEVQKEYVYGGEDLRFIDSYIPGMICAAASILSLVLTLISFVRERTRGTLFRMLVTPVSRWSIVLGYTLAFALIMILQTTILILVALYVFDVKLIGNIYLMMFVIILAGLGYQSIGVALSIYAKTEFQAFQFMPLIFTPSIFLSGIFAPIEALPEYVRPISKFIPLTYAVEAVKDIAIRNWGLMDVWYQVTVLVLFTLSMILIARLALGR